jgi:hypothetical protein
MRVIVVILVIGFGCRDYFVLDLANNITSFSPPLRIKRPVKVVALTKSPSR